MTKPKIGIISRDYYSKSNYKIKIAYNDLISAVTKSGGIPIIIPSNNSIKEYLNICQGFILQGGDDINNNNLNSIKLLREKNIPTLGICLGMQEMFYKNNLIDIKNHHIPKLHRIKIFKNTLLYKILKKESILVNSRHHSAINKTKHRISSISDDNTIESIEIKEHKFFLGLQWHPENLYKFDRNSKKIFDYFIDICKNNKN